MTIFRMEILYDPKSEVNIRKLQNDLGLEKQQHQAHIAQRTCVCVSVWEQTQQKKRFFLSQNSTMAAVNQK